MTVQEQERIDRLEATTRDLASRLWVVERELNLDAEPVAAPAAPSPPVSETPAPPAPPTRPSAQRPTTPAPSPHRDVLSTRGLEDLFGGRVLAWIGGIAVLVGLALFFALAVSNGWIGETARVVLAGVGAGSLLALGIWLGERKSQVEAALAAAGTGIAGLFMTVTVAAAVYELVPALPAFSLAAGVGVIAMVLAIRWRAQLIAALGIVGSLLAPVAVDAPSTGTTVALLFTVTAAAAAVLVWQRWDWLAVAAFCLATPQWVTWVFETDFVMGVFIALCAFGAAGVLAAVGFELRLPRAPLRASSSLLFALNAIVLAGVGYLALDQLGQDSLGRLWLAGLATAYVAIGIGGSRSTRISHDLGLLILTLGVLLGDIAFAAIVSGPLLAIGWALSSILFAAIARGRREFPSDVLLAQAGLGGHLALAIGHALVNDATPASVGGEADATGLLVTAAIAASCFSSARIGALRPDVRIALDAIGLASVAYLTALAVDGPALVVAWSVEAIALVRISRARGDLTAGAGAAGFVSLAMVHALVFEAPPESFLYGAADIGAAAVALGSTAAAVLALAWFGSLDRQSRVVAAATGAVTLLYLASVAIVSAVGAEDAQAVLDVGVRQQGQPLVSALWGVVGVAALISGLRRDIAELRMAALVLLLATAAKVFLFDLAALTEIYRVASFVALGLLLLVGSFAYQRLRPRVADLPAESV